jgi:uncharacterized protein YndB with AHSA1/START domain
VTNIGSSSSIVIHASADDVWRALTTPDMIKQWFFGVDTETDWKVGSPIVHSGEWQGKPFEDKGEILKVDPPHLLVHTHWSALSGRPDSPENYEEVAWVISEHDDGVELTITESNLPSGEAKALSEQNWRMVLNKLKELLER